MPAESSPAAAVALLPSTAALLVQGGDQRIAIQPASQANKYGCQPFPAPDRIAFASSTASQISACAFDAAERLRARIAAAMEDKPAAEVYGDELQRLREELMELLDMRAPAPDIVFAASGTDAHLLASQLAAAQSRRQGRALRVIMVNSEESGSGVSTALSGRSFSAYNALGDCSPRRISGGGETDPAVLHVAVRHPDGAPRSPQAVADDIDALADAAFADGCDVMLVLIDVSKTGCVSPEPAYARRLQQRAPGRVLVLVDACQFRIETASLQAYLADNFMVAITGSKFIGGPSFSAALLIPPVMAAAMRPFGAPAQLQRHSAREEWPEQWHAGRTLSSCANPGLLLRWEAALHELRAFQALPGADVRRFLLRFNAAVQARLQSDPHFSALPAAAMPRRADHLTPQWDDVPSIHAFSLYRRQAGDGAAPRPLDTAEVAHVYQQLQRRRHGDGFIYSVGQPVACGRRDGVEFSVLRLCVSAGMVVQACSDGQGHAGDALIAHAMACLDAIAALIPD